MAFSFGAPAATPAPATSTSLFGGFGTQPAAQNPSAPAATGTSLFGSVAPTNTGTGAGLFGSSAANTGTGTGASLFGNTANNATAGTSLFGGLGNQQPQQQQQQQQGQGQQQGQPGTFGAGTGTGTGSLFGNSNAQSSSLFSQPSQQQQQPSTTSSLFGQPQQQQQQQTLGTSLLNTTNNTLGTSLFGTASTQQSTARAPPVTRSKRTLQERLQIAAQGVIPSQEGYKLRVSPPLPHSQRPQGP